MTYHTFDILLYAQQSYFRLLFLFFIFIFIFLLFFFKIIFYQGTLDSLILWGKSRSPRLSRRKSNSLFSSLCVWRFWVVSWIYYSQQENRNWHARSHTHINTHIRRHKHQSGCFLRTWLPLAMEVLMSKGKHMTVPLSQEIIVMSFKCLFHKRSYNYCWDCDVFHVPLSQEIIQLLLRLWCLSSASFTRDHTITLEMNSRNGFWMAQTPAARSRHLKGSKERYLLGQNKTSKFSG